ncbi:C-type lectin domain family 17, member A-like [Macrobrachium rosenbergii]|uniref:C-type lectin domain family 17, member A-like n=1 Tax=Macrobrachium rosenbergii TaxID=79674 RepID=UPI0034D4C0E6
MLRRLVSFLSALAIVAGQCPDPYVPLDETRCILVDDFVLYTFDEAVSYCTGHGGTLLTINDCETFGLVYDFIHTEVGALEHHYWLGASDAAEEGTWKFVDNQPVPMGTPFWVPGRPVLNTASNCAILDFSFQHKWYDIGCTSTFSAICLRNV